MAKKRATLTDLLNDLTFKMHYDRLKLVALNMFTWDGLPAGITERHVESLLFEHGKALFFRDPTMSYMCLQTDEGANLNVYNEPLAWRAIGNGYNELYDADECVLIENNKLRVATDDFVMFFANKLTEAERTMDVNVKANKTPYIFACDEKDVLTFKRIFQQIDGNVPAIYADRGLNLGSLQVFQTGVRFLCGELTDYKHSIESDALTFLGVNNVAVDKKERLITDEAESNDELISAFRELQLEARQRACEAINAKWGLNVSVRARGEVVDNSVEKEGNDDVDGSDV